MHEDKRAPLAAQLKLLIACTLVDTRASSADFSYHCQALWMQILIGTSSPYGIFGFQVLKVSAVMHRAMTAISAFMRTAARQDVLQAFGRPCTQSVQQKTCAMVYLAGRMLPHLTCSYRSDHPLHAILGAAVPVSKPDTSMLLQACCLWIVQQRPSARVGTPAWRPMHCRQG